MTQHISLFLLVVGCATTFAVFGETPCTSCADPAPDAQSTAFLQQLGLDSAHYRVLMRWTEPPHNGSGAAVTGYRIAGPGTAKPFDAYADGNGVPLGKEALHELGIVAKRWDVAPMSAATESGAAPTAKSVPTVVPLSPSLSPHASSRVTLPALDIPKLMAEDDAREQSAAKGRLRIGTSVDLPEPVVLQNGNVSTGQWTPLPQGGALWSTTLASPGAIGVRVHFEALNLPPESHVTVYNPSNPTEAFGPYRGTGNAVWSTTCFAESVVVECYVPSIADASRVGLIIDKVAEVYRPFDELPWAKAYVKSAGTCNLDVTCYPEWATVARGVGGLYVISGLSMYWCTGTLIVDGDPNTAVPYFLTAHHCVTDQAEASTMEVYWLYQTSTCNGVPPSLYSVPRTTGGADYVIGTDTYTGTDMTLLRLHNTPPVGIPFVGWSARPLTVGQAVATIHHPSIDFKRISFGTFSYNTPTRHGVYWTLGTTQPGSSGGPLLIPSEQVIVGTLFGGGASCATQDLPDEFGRFDLTWPLFAPYLGTDTDGDGLYDNEEVDGIYGPPTNPSLPDTDGDGLTDYQEEMGTFGPVTDPTVPDTDGDGLTDSQEELGTLGYVTDPTVPDTDGDGLTDHQEELGTLGYVSNPLVLDTDHDGLTDYQEAMGTFGYLTNPGLADTDGDGISDWTEEMLGLNPLVPDVSGSVPSLSAPWFGTWPTANLSH